MATFTVRSRSIGTITSTSVTAATAEAAIYNMVSTGVTGQAEIQVLSAALA